MTWLNGESPIPVISVLYKGIYLHIVFEDMHSPPLPFPWKLPNHIVTKISKSSYKTNKIGLVECLILILKKSKCECKKCQMSFWVVHLSGRFELETWEAPIDIRDNYAFIFFLITYVLVFLNSMLWWMKIKDKISK